MALVKSFKHPLRPGDFQGYAWIGEVNLNVAAGRGRIVVFVHENAEAAAAGYPPVFTVPIELRAQGTPAVYGPPPELTPRVPAVTEQVQVGTDEDGNPVYQTVVVTPEQPPTYGPAPEIEPAIPPFMQLVARNLPAYEAIMTSSYQVILTRQLFAGSAVVPTSHLGLA